MLLKESVNFPRISAADCFFPQLIILIYSETLFPQTLLKKIIGTSQDIIAVQIQM